MNKLIIIFLATSCLIQCSAGKKISKQNITFSKIDTIFHSLREVEIVNESIYRELDDMLFDYPKCEYFKEREKVLPIDCYIGADEEGTLGFVFTNSQFYLNDEYHSKDLKGFFIYKDHTFILQSMNRFIQKNYFRFTDNIQQIISLELLGGRQLLFFGI